MEPFVLLPSAGQCSRHPGAPAGWRCEVCDAVRCPGCVYAERDREGSLTLCAACGGLARRIHLARVPAPLGLRLTRALALPLRRGNLAAFAGLVALLTLLSAFRGGGIAARLFGAPQWILGFFEMAFFWSTFFGTVRAAHQGERRLPIPALGDLWHELLLPGIRGELATFPLLFLGALGRHDFVVTGVGEQEVSFVFLFTPLWSPLEASYLHGLLGRLSTASAWVFAAWVVYLAWLPLALASISLDGSLLDALHPGAIFARARALGTQLLQLIFEVCGLGALALWLQLVLDEPLHRLAVLGPLVLSAVTLWLLFAVAALLGDFLAVHGARLGLGTEADHSAPALPLAVPRGRERTANPPQGFR